LYYCDFVSSLFSMIVGNGKVLWGEGGCYGVGVCGMQEEVGCSGGK
jgi:hypothetical protein